MKKRLLLVIIILLACVVRVKADNFDFTITIEKETMYIGESMIYDVTQTSSSTCKGATAIKIADESIARLEDGKVVALNSGTTTLDIEWCGIKKSANIIVTERTPFNYDVIIEKSEIAVGEKTKFTIEEIDQTGCRGAISYKIANEKIARVENGEILGLASGETVLNVRWCGIEKTLPIKVTGGICNSLILGLIVVFGFVIAVVIVKTSDKKNKKKK